MCLSLPQNTLRQEWGSQMKDKKTAGLLAIFLFLSAITGVQGIEWGTESAWTAENVKTHPLEAFTANPEKAVGIYPQILEDNDISKKWFNEGDAASHIKLQPQYAKKYFEGNGLGEIGGKHYILHLSNGNIELVNGRSDITISGITISNAKGPSLILEGYPSGTKIEPNGINGFKVIPPGEQGVSVTGASSKAGYGSGKLIIEESGKKMLVGTKDVSGVDIKGGNEYTITTTEGRAITVLSEKEFEFSNGILRVGKGSAVKEQANTAVTTSYGPTSIKFTGREGYEITGNFKHEFDSGLGKITVPSREEAIARFNGALQGEDLRFCYKCGSKVEDIGDRSVIFDGKDFYSSGKVSTNILNEEGQHISGGAIKGVVYRTNGREIEIIKNPDDGALRLAAITSIEEKGRQLERRLLESELDGTRSVIQSKIDELPQRLSEEMSDSEILELRGGGALERDYIPYKDDYYKKSDIDDYAKFETLVASTNIKGNSVYASAIGYDLADNEYDLKINKIGLFSDAITGTEKEPIDFVFKAGKEKWEIKDGSFYHKDEQLDYYTDLSSHIKKNGNYAVKVHGDVSGLLADLSGTGAAKDLFKGKDMALLDLNVGKDSLVLRSEIDEELINDIKGRGAKLWLGSWGFNYAEEFEKKIADEMKLYADPKFVNGKIGMLADKGILPQEVAQTIENYISGYFSKAQETGVLDQLEMVKGFEVVMGQKPAQAEMSFKILTPEGDIAAPAAVLNTGEKNLLAEANSRLADVSRAKGWEEVLNRMVPEQLKAWAGK